MMQMNTKRVSESYSLPAPVGGLNARDSVAAMPETDAVVMDNWFPRTTDIVTRGGSLDWATELPAVVETLMHYNSGTQNQLFGISEGNIYDVTASGDVDDPVVEDLTNSRWQFVNYGTPGGQFLEACNGEDDMLLYDGTDWVALNAMSSPAITGVDTSLIKDINIFKNRIWLIEKESMRAWYLPFNSIAGAATAFDFSSLFRRGGSLTCMVTWTINETSGIQDFAAFVTNEGEVALYQGIDPSSASTWALVGIFRIGRPIGQRCYAKFGSDVILLTADGFFPLSKALLSDRSDAGYALSDKILNLVNADVQVYGTNFGWQPILYPIGNKFIINVPQVENILQHQYVMNTITSAWCRFTGWNAACFDVFQDQLYFGTNNVVRKADIGSADNNDNINCLVVPAFSYFGTPGINKRFTMVRQIFMAPGTIVAATVMNVNFSTQQPTQTPTYTGNNGPLWNTFLWNTRQWGGGNSIQQDWQTVTGIGYCGSLTTQVATKTFSVAWLSGDYVYEKGTVL